MDEKGKHCANNSILRAAGNTAGLPIYSDRVNGVSRGHPNYTSDSARRCQTHRLTPQDSKMVSVPR